MALQIKTSKNFCGKEINFDTAYLKITSKTTTGDQVVANITIYSDSTKEYTLNEYCDNFTVDISDNAINEYKQIYRQLRENKYTDAVDLLDEGQTV
jgi:hypothetical protein